MKINYLTVILCVSAIAGWAQDSEGGKLLVKYQRTSASMEMESAAPHARGLGGMISQHSTLHYPTINTCLTVYETGDYLFEKIDE